MSKLLLLFALLSPSEVYGQLRVGIIDSGLDLHDPRFTKVLCKEGHRDFSGHGIIDSDGHGTHVAGLIKKYAKDANYCLVIYKFYHTEWSTPPEAFDEALQYALRDNLDIINISGGGPIFHISEYNAIMDHPEVKVVTAAGNEGADLAKQPYFPAAYPLSNVYAIGNGKDYEDKAPTSNYGTRVMYWEDGQKVESTYPLWKCGFHDRPKGKDCRAKLSGTSMSSAIYTGKWVGSGGLQ